MCIYIYIYVFIHVRIYMYTCVYIYIYILLSLNTLWSYVYVYMAYVYCLTVLVYTCRRRLRFSLIIGSFLSMGVIVLRSFIFLDVYVFFVVFVDVFCMFAEGAHVHELGDAPEPRPLLVRHGHRLVHLLLDLVLGAVLGLRTSGVSTNGAAAEVRNFDGLGEKGTPWHFWEETSRLTGVPQKVPLSKNKKFAVTH